MIKIIQYFFVKNKISFKKSLYQILCKNDSLDARNFQSFRRDFRDSDSQLDF